MCETRLKLSCEVDECKPLLLGRRHRADHDGRANADIARHVIDTQLKPSFPDLDDIL